MLRGLRSLRRLRRGLPLLFPALLLLLLRGQGCLGVLSWVLLATRGAQAAVREQGRLLLVVREGSLRSHGSLVPG
eukprot:5092205-Pyramimonas_sp.AAC.1